MNALRKVLWCVSFLTLPVFVDTTLVAQAQHIIENRGQWDGRIAFVVSGARVAVRADGAIVSATGSLEAAVPDSCTVVARGLCPAVLHYYTAAGSVEGVRTFSALEWRRGQHVVATLQWEGRALVFQRVDDPSGAPRTLATDAESRRPVATSATGPRIAAWGIGGRFVGSSASDSIARMAILDGSIIVAGWTDAATFPGSGNASSGGRDAFVARLSADGTLTWASLIGGSGNDAAVALAATTDAIAIGGRTESSTFPTTSGVVQPSYGGGTTDGFVATFDPATGTKRAASFIGGSGDDAVTGVALGNGPLAVAATTNSTNLPATAHQQQPGGFDDGYVALLTPQLSSRLWSTYYGGRGFDAAAGIAFLGDGSVVIAGTTGSPNTGQAIAAGIGEGSERATLPDGFLARLDAQGQRLWGRYYGSDGQDSITSIAVSSSGLVLITGMTNGTNTANSYIATASAAQNQFAGGQWDGFVAVLRPDGTRLWGSYYGGTGSDRCTAAAMDAQGYLLVTGWTTSADFPLAHSDNTTLAGDADAFVGFFSTDGTRRIASLLYGGAGADLPCGIGWMPDSSIAVAGSTTSASFSPLSGSTAGALDGFLLRLQSLGILSVPFGDASLVIAPSGEALSITLPEHCAPAALSVYTLGGILIARDHIGAGAYRRALPMGVYAVVLACSDGKTIRQLVMVW